MSKTELFPYGVFQPSSDDGDLGSGCVLANLTLPGGLRVIARDSAPFDKITYLINDEPVANEYVGEYKDKFDQIKTEPEAYVVALWELQASNV